MFCVCVCALQCLSFLYILYFFVGCCWLPLSTHHMSNIFNALPWNGLDFTFPKIKPHRHTCTICMYNKAYQCHISLSERASLCVCVSDGEKSFRSNCLRQNSWRCKIYRIDCRCNPTSSYVAVLMFLLLGYFKSCCRCSPPECSHSAHITPVMYKMQNSFRSHTLKVLHISLSLSRTPLLPLISLSDISSFILIIWICRHLELLSPAIWKAYFRDSFTHIIHFIIVLINCIAFHIIKFGCWVLKVLRRIHTLSILQLEIVDPTLVFSCCSTWICTNSPCMGCNEMVNLCEDEKKNTEKKRWEKNLNNQDRCENFAV